jgi:squalene-hopene/tetraprenyl-beta-curcumene cyclase
VSPGAPVPLPARPPRAGSLAPEPEVLDRACERARDGLLAQQRPDGHWSYRLQTNVCMEAEYLLLGRILGRSDPGRERRLVARILADQLPDGGFPTYVAGPADADVTVEALTALRAAGLPADHPRVAAARAAAARLGGVAATRVFTRMWLACCGLHPWEGLPELPPEMLLIPERAPLGLARFASWARATIVPLTVVLTLRPGTDAVVLEPGAIPEGEPGGPRRPAPSGPTASVFLGVDRLLGAYRRLPRQPGRARALARAEAWILDHQDVDGAIGGIQPPMAYQCLALHALGHRRGSPALERAWNAFEGYVIEDGERCEVQACLSPVWDTGLAMLAIADLGVPPDDPALRRAARWLLDEEVRVRGDWARMRPRLPAGGWAFEYHNDLYPDVDDTAIVLCALGAARLEGRDDAVLRGLRWMLGMRCRDGGVAAFDAENRSRLVERIPFCDFGAVTDPPSADVTGHVLEACGRWGLSDTHRDVAAMRAWLLRHQEADGSWFGRWGVNHVYGTAAVLPGLVAAGLHRLHPAVQRGVGWLLAAQREDGAFGEDCGSYRDPALRGRGEATASQTAWGLQGLCAGGEAGSGAAARAARWLVEQQGEDGLWRDARFTGTGFPGDFFLLYHGYAAYFPGAALGRYRRTRPAAGRQQAGRAPIKLTGAPPAAGVDAGNRSGAALTTEVR